MTSTYKLRMEAAKRGERTFLGHFCKVEDHGGRRYTSNGICVQCVKERADKRQKKLRDLLKAPHPTDEERN